MSGRFGHTPWSALSPWRKARRALGWLFAASAGAMAVSASTASSDWEITQQDVAEKFG